MLGHDEQKDPRLVCKDYIETVTENINSFLQNKSHVLNVNLESAEDDFTRFCERISADVNLSMALEHFKIAHNASN